MRLSGAERQKRYREAHPEKVKAAWTKANHTPEAKLRSRVFRRRKSLKLRYNMTACDVTKMLLRQGGCAVCHTWDSGDRDWCIDHDHRCCPYSQNSFVPLCGKCVRGVLCNKCNMGLGYLKDDPQIVESALNYLRSAL